MLPANNIDDYILFRFRRIDKHFLQSLVNSELHFARPEALNDPFDCRVDFRASLERAIIRAEGANQETLKELRRIMNEDVRSDEIRAFVENIGVCSFSLTLENTLMWSHYADNHRGVCLTYGFPKAFFDETVNDILGIVKVDYGPDPLSDWFLHILDESVSLDRFIRLLIKKAFTVKAELWRHEEEARIVRKTAGIQSIDRNFLKQVCFGLATPDADIALVKNIIARCGYDVALCRMRRNEASDFGLEPIEIEPSATRERQVDNCET
ncbi:MAG: DUF2971 domain-containing protein [Deltaproteobacteria bacterium]|nr:DUF2971 domain-containing protein [Deltaproteobacteria bacterium]